MTDGRIDRAPHRWHTVCLSYLKEKEHESDAGHTGNYIWSTRCNPELYSAAGAALDDHDALGPTPLMTAAWGNSTPAVVALLPKSGADAKAKSGSGETALHYAWDKPSRSAGSEAYQALKAVRK